MTDTFRALCAEVLAFNNGEGCYNFSSLKPSDRDNAAFDAWQDTRQRLKSALAQPELEGPGPVDYRRWYEAHSEDCNTWSEQPTAPLTLRTTVEALAWANYCLARWGRPAIEPVLQKTIDEPQSPHPFIVKHYSSDERPTIKGNGFDGLEVGEDREEAEHFIAWVNARLVELKKGRPAIQSEEGWYPSFADWLEREMPEGTVIGDPLWWASMIATYLQRLAIQPVPTPEPGTADHITDDEGRRWDRTMDAALWAKAFCLICPEMASREDVMIGWFANAIMAGCDHQAWKMDAERKPVPVSERLPGLEDCDTRGRCWFIDDDEKWWPVIIGDILDEDEPDAIQRVICYYGYTHWVQGWALPVPSSPTPETP